MIDAVFNMPMDTGKMLGIACGIFHPFLQREYIRMQFAVQCVMAAKAVEIGHQCIEIRAFAMAQQIVSQESEQRICFFAVNQAAVSGQFTVFIDMAMGI